MAKRRTHQITPTSRGFCRKIFGGRAKQGEVACRSVECFVARTRGLLAGLVGKCLGYLQSLTAEISFLLYFAIKALIAPRLPKRRKLARDLRFATHVGAITGAALVARNLGVPDVIVGPLLTAALSYLQSRHS